MSIRSTAGMTCEARGEALQGAWLRTAIPMVMPCGRFRLSLLSKYKDDANCHGDCSAPARESEGGVML